MARRFVPKTEFENDLPGYKDQVKTYITSYYTEHGVGPTQEEVRDATGLGNDLVTYILKDMVKDGTEVIMIQA